MCSGVAAACRGAATFVCVGGKQAYSLTCIIICGTIDQNREGVMSNLIILSLTGALSFNSTLFDVGLTRAAGFTAYPINKDPAAYSCRLGVPYSYTYLIGQELYFLPDSGGLIGPFLVTDIEADIHAGQMTERDLLADIDCMNLVHQTGRLGIMEIYR